MTVIVVEKNVQEKSIASFLVMNIIRASCLNAFLFLTILVRVKGRCNINPLTLMVCFQTNITSRFTTTDLQWNMSVNENRCQQ